MRILTRRVTMSLDRYRQKRSFDRTPEPPAKAGRKKLQRLSFVVQKHAASHLHYDFRLELGGVLKSWAVPKGPSLNPKDRQLAVEVEDHPLPYRHFEGVIPAGEYGAGEVIVWDQGVWTPLGDAAASLSQGKLKFTLAGDKLHGAWTLVRMRDRDSDRQPNWLLIKDRDQFADATTGAKELRNARPESVLSGRTLEQLAAAPSPPARSASQTNVKARSRTPPTSKASPATQSPAKSRKHPKKKSARVTAPRQKSLPRRTTPRKLPALDFSRLTRARLAPQPATLSPQLATLADSPPTSSDWLHELKFDGYRLLAFKSAGQVRLLTRSGQDWTRKFPGVATALHATPHCDCILDGEVVVLDDQGLPSFQRLQNALQHGRHDALVYYIFDLPWADGWDLRQTPLLERKTALQKLLRAPTASPANTLRYSEHHLGHGAELATEACRLHWEGIVSKRADSHYESRRSPAWRKTKCQQRQEFIIGGVTSSTEKTRSFGSLLLGVYDGGQLRYCGRVGTGWTEASRRELGAELQQLQSAVCPFQHVPDAARRSVDYWTRPELVVEISFAEWTNDGILRHPSFQGVRRDKPAQQVLREAADMAPTPRPSKSPASRRRAATQPKENNTAEVAGVALSNPQRVLFEECGVTKIDLARFYEDIAEWILPHVTGRPLSLVRCPGGRQKNCFFQKHLDASAPPQLQQVLIQESSTSGHYPVLRDLAGLIALVQLGVLEIHPWGARSDDVERPDRMVFDLDPGPGVDWPAVVQAAFDVRERLQDLGLESFPRTSGGKGLHVVVPLQRRHDWDLHKAFAHGVAATLANEHPDRYTESMSKARRQGRIFIDYLRNGRGATAIASYSTRARAGAPVATPVAWDEINESLQPDRWNVQNLPARLAQLEEDPWDGFFTIRQSLTQQRMRKLLQH